MLESATDIVASIFHQPRKVLSYSTQSFRIIVEQCREVSMGPSVVTFHKRCGRTVHSDSKVLGFNPCLVEPLEREHTVYSQSQWVMASISFDTFIEIVAFPIDSLLNDQRFYLSSRLLLPPDCRVMDMKFYGDDGGCAFKVEQCEAVDEGRQALGLVVERTIQASIPNKDERRFNEELWLVEYDSLVFRYVMNGLESENNGEWKITIDGIDGTRESTAELVTTFERNEGNDLSPCFAKCELSMLRRLNL
jgi:hypothetical protein